MWYAVTKNGDYDWSYGSESLQRAIKLAEQEIENGESGVEIAAIEEDELDNFCVYALYKDDEGDWVRES